MANQGSVVLDIRAQITGYQQEITKIQNALKNIKIGSSIGSDLRKQLAEAEREVESLSKHLDQRISSMSQLQTLFDRFNNINGIFKDIGSGLQKVPWDEILSGATEAIANVRKEINTLSESMQEKTSTLFNNMSKSIPELQNIMNELEFNPKSMKLEEFVENLDAAIDRTSQKIKELKDQQDELTNRQAIAAQQVTAGKGLGTVLSNEGLNSSQIKAALGASTKIDINNILTQNLQNNIETFKNSLLAGLSTDARAADPDLMDKLKKELDDKFVELEKQVTQDGVNKILQDINGLLASTTIDGTGFGTQIKGLTQKTTAEWREILSVMPSDEFIAKLESMASKLESSSIKDQLTSWISDLSNVKSADEFKSIFDSIINAIRQGAKEVREASKLGAEDIVKAEEELEKIKPQIQELESRAATYNSVKSATAPQIDSLMKEMRGYGSRIEELEKKITSIENGQAGKTTPLTSLGQEIENKSKKEINDSSAIMAQYGAQLDQVRAKEKLIGKIEGVVQRWFSIYAVVRMVSNAIKSMISTVKELDTTITEIAIVTKMDQSDLWGQMDSYTEMARQYAASISGVYKVSQLYYQQGLQTADVMALTEQTLKMARISGLDYAEATDYMTNAVRSFKMEMTDASTVVDVYSAVAASSATSVAELATAMSKTASSAQAVGASFENTTAMMAVMIEATRESPENIGSAMKSIISRYGELKENKVGIDSEGEEYSLNKVDKALQTVGVSAHDAAGAFRDFDEVIMELAEKWDTIDTNTQRYIATVMAGNRQQSRFLALVSSYDRLKELSTTAADSENASQQQYLKTLDSIDAKTQQLKTSLQSLYISGGFEQLYKGLLDTLNNIIISFNNLSKAAGTPLAAIVKFGALFGSIANVVTSTFALIKRNFTARMAALTKEANQAVEGANAASVQSRINQEQRVTSDFAAQCAQRVTTFTSSLDQMTVAYAVWYQNMQGIGQKKPGGPPVTQLLPGQTSGYAGGNQGQGLSVIPQQKQAGPTTRVMFSDGSYIPTEGTIGSDYTLSFGSRLRQLKGTLSSKLQTPQGMAITSLLGSLLGSIFTSKAMSMSEKTEGERVGKAGYTLLGSVAQGAGYGAMVGHPLIGAAIGLVSGLAQAIGIVHETIDEKVNRLSEEAQEATNTSIKSTSEAKELEKTITNLEKLEKTRNDSKEAAEEYASAVEAAAKTYPELVSYYDAEGNAVINLAESYDVLARAREQAASDAKDAAIKSVALAEGYKEQTISNTSDKVQGFFNNPVVKETRDNYKDFFGGYGVISEDLETPVFWTHKMMQEREYLTQEQYDLISAIWSENAAVVPDLLKKVVDTQIQPNVEGLSTGDAQRISQGVAYFLSLASEIAGASSEVKKASDNVIDKENAGISTVLSSKMQSDRLSAQYGGGKNVDYLTEFDSASEIINNFVKDRFTQLKEQGVSYEDFMNNTDAEKGINAAYEEISESINEFWSVQSNSSKDAFNTLLSSRGQYSETQFKGKLESIFGKNTEDDPFFKAIMDYYADAYSEIDFNKAIKANGRDEYSRMQDIIASFQARGTELGGDEWQQLLSVMDTIIAQQKGGKLSVNAGADLLDQYVAILNSTDKMQEIQSLIVNGDIFSLQGLEALESQITEAVKAGKNEGQDVSGILQAIDNMKKLIYVNLNTELENLLTGYAKGIENFDKDLSSATSGMDFKSAVEMAQKLGKTLNDFNYRNGKYYYDNINDLQNFYTQEQQKSEQDIKNRIERQKQLFTDEEIDFFSSQAMYEASSRDWVKNYVESWAEQLEQAGYTPEGLLMAYDDYQDDVLHQVIKDNGVKGFQTYLKNYFGDINTPLDELIKSTILTLDFDINSMITDLSMPIKDIQSRLEEAKGQLPEGIDIDLLVSYITSYREEVANGLDQSFSEWVVNYLTEQEQAILANTEKYFKDQQARTLLSTGRVNEFVDLTLDKQSFENSTLTNKYLDKLKQFSGGIEYQGMREAAAESARAELIQRISSGNVTNLPAELQKYAKLIYDTYNKIRSSIADEMLAQVSSGGNTPIFVTETNKNVLAELRQKGILEGGQTELTEGDQLNVAKDIINGHQSFFEVVNALYTDEKSWLEGLQKWHETLNPNKIAGTTKMMESTETVDFNDFTSYLIETKRIGQDAIDSQEKLTQQAEKYGLEYNKATGNYIIKSQEKYLQQLTIDLGTLNDTNSTVTDRNEIKAKIDKAKLDSATKQKSAVENVLKNYQSLSVDNIKDFADAFKEDYEQIKNLIVKSNGDGTFRLDITGLREVLKSEKISDATRRLIEELIAGITDSYLESISNAMSYMTKGTTKTVDIQKFVNEYNNKFKTTLISSDLFAWNDILNAYTLKPEYLQTYIEMQKEELIAQGFKEDFVNDYINNQIKLIQESVDISSFIFAESRAEGSKARQSLENQMRASLAAQTDFVTAQDFINLPEILTEAIQAEQAPIDIAEAYANEHNQKLNEAINQQIKNDIMVLEAGGQAAINVLKTYKPDASTNDIEAVYKSKVNRISSAMEKLLTLEVGDVLDDTTIATLGSSITVKDNVVTSIGDLVAAYEQLYEEMASANEATTSDLNKAYAQVLKVREQGEIDAISALQDAMGMTYEALGDLLARYDKSLEQEINNGWFERIGNGKVRITDFNAFADYMQWRRGSEEYTSAFKAYNDSLIQLDKNAKETIYNEINAITSAKPGNQINLTYTTEAILKFFDQDIIGGLDQQLVSYGAFIKDGIMHLSDDANIPAILDSIVSVIQENDMTAMAQNQVDAIKDALNTMLSNVVSTIRNGMTGSLTNVQVTQLQEWSHQNGGAKLDFTETAQGLQLTENSFFTLYAQLRKTNSLMAKSLLPDMTKMSKQYSSLSGTLRAYENAAEEGAKKLALKDLVTSQLRSPDSYNLMGGNLPDDWQMAANYYGSYETASKAIQTMGQKGNVDANSFYQLMNNIASRKETQDKLINGKTAAEWLREAPNFFKEVNGQLQVDTASMGLKDLKQLSTLMDEAFESIRVLGDAQLKIYDSLRYGSKAIQGLDQEELYKDGILNIDWLKQYLTEHSEEQSVKDIQNLLNQISIGDDTLATLINTDNLDEQKKQLLTNIFKNLQNGDFDLSTLDEDVLGLFLGAEGGTVEIDSKTGQIRFVVNEDSSDVTMVYKIGNQTFASQEEYVKWELAKQQKGAKEFVPEEGEAGEATLEYTISDQSIMLSIDAEGKVKYSVTINGKKITSDTEMGIKMAIASAGLLKGGKAPATESPSFEIEYGDYQVHVVLGDDGTLVVDGEGLPAEVIQKAQEYIDEHYGNKVDLPSLGMDAEVEQIDLALKNADITFAENNNGTRTVTIPGEVEGEVKTLTITAEQFSQLSDESKAKIAAAISANTYSVPLTTKTDTLDEILARWQPKTKVIPTILGTPHESYGNVVLSKGNVALAGGTPTLMGELGPELVVSHGRYFVVGQGGAEMVNLADDAIVFNHIQTRQLLSNGKTGRGTPTTNDRVSAGMATGNVNGGPAMPTGRGVGTALEKKGKEVVKGKDQSQSGKKDTELTKDQKSKLSSLISDLITKGFDAIDWEDIEKTLKKDLTDKLKEAAEKGNLRDFVKKYGEMCGKTIKEVNELYFQAWQKDLEAVGESEELLGAIEGLTFFGNGSVGGSASDWTTLLGNKVKLTDLVEQELIEWDAALKQYIVKDWDALVAELKKAGVDIDTSQIQALKEDSLKAMVSSIADLLEKAVEGALTSSDLNTLNEYLKQNGLAELSKEFLTQTADGWIVSLKGIQSLITSISANTALSTELKTKLTATLNDTLLSTMESIGDIITSALEGSLKGADLTKLNDFLRSNGIAPVTLDSITQTTKGLKMSTAEAARLYASLKTVDAIAAQITFKQLNESLRESDEHYKTMSSTLARIKELQDKIANASKYSDEKVKQYKEELELAKEIAAVRATSEDDSMNFLDQAIPGAMNNPLNYINSWITGYKSLRDALATGGSGVVDFKSLYNMAREINSQAQVSGSALDFFGQKLDGSAESLAKFAQAAGKALGSSKDGTFGVILSKLGTDLKDGAASYSTSADAAMKQMAKSQIKILDGLIAFFEAVVAMENFEGVDKDKNGILDLSEIFVWDKKNDEATTTFTKKYKDAATKVLKAAEDNSDLKVALEKIKLNGYSLKKLLQEAVDKTALSLKGIDTKTYQQAISVIYEAFKNGDYDLNSIAESLMETLAANKSGYKGIINLGSIAFDVKSKVKVTQKDNGKWEWTDADGKTHEEASAEEAIRKGILAKANVKDIHWDKETQTASGELTIQGKKIKIVSDKKGTTYTYDGTSYDSLDKAYEAIWNKLKEEGKTKLTLEQWKIEQGIVIAPKVSADADTSSLTAEQIKQAREMTWKDVQTALDAEGGDYKKFAIKYGFEIDETTTEADWEAFLQKLGVENKKLDLDIHIKSFDIEQDAFSEGAQKAIRELLGIGEDGLILNLTGDALKDAEKLEELLKSLTDRKVKVEITGGAIKDLNNIISKLSSIVGKTITVKVKDKTGGKTDVKGNVALAAGRTLMGELGPELVVANGKYYTVGNNGAEFVDLPKDAIVFNHLQTKRLLSNGSSGRGVPAVSEAAAVSMAAGNALASASETLANLKALRAMWQSLADSSIKNLVGTASSSSSGGNNSNSANAWLKTVERWYNWLQKIARLEKEINYQEQLRTKLSSDLQKDGKQYYATQMESLANLKQQAATWQDLAREYAEHFELRRRELNAENSPLSQFYTYDENGQLKYKEGGFQALSAIMRQNDQGVTITPKEQYDLMLKYGLGEYMKYNSEGQELVVNDGNYEQYYRDAVQAAWDRMESERQEMQSLYDSKEDAKIKYLEKIDSANKILQDILNNQMELENKVLDAIEKRERAVIDQMSKEREALSKSTESYIKGLSDTLTKERNMYQRSDDTTELNKLRRQLNILQRSGGSASSIASLQSQISQKDREAYFNAQQDSIDAIQDASNLELEKLQNQIDLMTETLEYQKANGLLWTEVRQIMAGSSEQIAAFITGNDTEWAAKSDLAKSQDLETLIFSADKWVQYREGINGNFTELNVAMANGFDKLVAPLTEQSTVLANVQSTIEKYGLTIVQKLHTLNPKQVSSDTSSGGDGTSELDYSSTSDDTSEDGGKKSDETTKPKYNYKGTLNLSYQLTDHKNIRRKTLTADGSGNTKKEAQQAIIAEFAKQVEKLQNQSNLKDKSLWFTKDDEMWTGYESGSWMKHLEQAIAFTKYALGGDVNYTGPAMLHGTELHPETVLSAPATQQWKTEITGKRNTSLMSRLAELGNVLAGIEKVSNSHIDKETDSSISIENASVNMYVDQIANDYDARRAGNQALEKILEVARKSNGNNRIGR